MGALHMLGENDTQLVRLARKELRAAEERLTSRRREFDRVRGTYDDTPLSRGDEEQIDAGRELADALTEWVRCKEQLHQARRIQRWNEDLARKEEEAKAEARRLRKEREAAERDAALVDQWEAEGGRGLHVP